jgi:hypothetical protein
VHFYLEARPWPTSFVFDHEKKIELFEYIECPLSVLPQRDGKPYLRENFLFWLPDFRVAIAMVDQSGPGEFLRLRVFLKQFLPLLRSCPNEMVDLFIVTPDQRRRFVYQKLLQRSRAILKLGVGPFLGRVNHSLYDLRCQQSLRQSGLAPTSTTSLPISSKIPTTSATATPTIRVSSGRSASDAQINAVSIARRIQTSAIQKKEKSRTQNCDVCDFCDLPWAAVDEATERVLLGLLRLPARHARNAQNSRTSIILVT